MKRCLALLVLLALIPGCGTLLEFIIFGPEGSPFGKETGSSELKAFENERDAADYFAGQISARNEGFLTFDRAALGGQGSFDSDAPDAAPGAPNQDASIGAEGGDDGADGGDFSQTTIQEQGVDEADVVKTDGRYLYIIHNAFEGSVLRIVQATPPEELAAISEIPLEGSGREIYLYGDKIVALTTKGGGYFVLAGGGIATEPTVVDEVATDEGGGAAPGSGGADDDPEPDVDDSGPEPGFINEYRYERPRTVVTVIDVSSAAGPGVLSKTRFDGMVSSSRMIEGVLHLVLSNYQDYYYDVLPLLGRPELDVSEVEVEPLLPKYERVEADGVVTSGTVLSWEELYHPVDPDGFGVVTVVSLDIDREAEFSAVGVVAEPGLIYSSTNALYVTDTDYNFVNELRETTDIYKFAYVERGAVPVATGSVFGRVLNQYSMGEYGGYLRVATTVGATFNLLGQRLFGPSNNVYVLSATEAGLDVVGSVEDIAPGETITSARFLGDRGYLVTFERIDPLHTLDLADPTDPHVEGELEVPGFSTFITPIDADHLLAVGQYIPDEGPSWIWGVQLSLFDVSDFANPERTANVVLGAETGASSEALYDPKAFTYFAERGLVAFPVSLNNQTFIVDDVFVGEESVDPDGTVVDGGDDGTTEPQPPPDDLIEPIAPPIPETFEGLYVFEVSIESGLSALGRISTRLDDSGYYWPWFTRGVFIGDTVFAVTDRGVFGAPLDNLESQPYQLVLESAAGIDDEVLPADDK